MSNTRGQQRGRGRGSGPPSGGAGRGVPARGGPPARGSGGFGGGGRGRGVSPMDVYNPSGNPPRVDARLAAAETALAALRGAPYDAKNPLRPGFGTLGEKVVLRVNQFAVKVTNPVIYEYKVEIEPKTNVGAMKGRILELMEETQMMRPYISHIAHDRTERLVSAVALPQPLQVKFPFYEKGQGGPSPNPTMYTTTIKLVADLQTKGLMDYLEGRPEDRDYDTLPVISALNLVIQQHANRTGFRVGRNRHFFAPSPNQKMSIGLGVEALKGFFTSVRPSFRQLMVNVNFCFTAFYEPGNLVAAIQMFQQRSHGGLPSRFIQKLKIRTRHLGHSKAVFRIMSTNARNTKFHYDKLGRQVTVEEYFQSEYPNIPLRYANSMPVVDIGNKKRSIFIPAELCDITGGTAYMGKLDGTETANMIRHACNPPVINAESIVNQGFPKLGLGSGSQRQGPLEGFGIEISNEMAVVPGRILPPPGLSYKAGRATVKDGGWNILNVKFQKGASLAPSWAVLVVRDGRPEDQVFTRQDDAGLVDLYQGFSQKLKSAGVVVPAAPPKVIITDPLPGPRVDPDRSKSMDVIRSAIVKNLNPKAKPSFILVLLCREDNFIYPGVKYLGDVKLGIQTVCMLLTPKKAMVADTNKRDQYYSNVALKVNTKLGGNNHLLDNDAMKWLREKKTMLIGCDVTHPGPSSVLGTPSIAAVVASVDADFVQYPASLRCQESRKEMITELDKMVVERLQLYLKKNKTLPERVIIFRDGVSEGQFDTVLEEELPLVQKAFNQIYKTSKHPLLTIIICGKRHHIRSYASSANDATKNGNTKPGTIIDQGVSNLRTYDFYLQAHAGLQGNVKSTHYTVVYDECRFGPDVIQQGTHTASYSYARATKAVSLIPPAYYADIACERGRLYLNEYLNIGETASTAGTALSRDEEKRRVYNKAIHLWGAGVHEDLRDSMFYI